MSWCSSSIVQIWSLHITYIYIIIITLIERGLGGLVFIYCAWRNLVLLECCHQVPACSGYFYLEYFRSFTFCFTHHMTLIFTDNIIAFLSMLRWWLEIIKHNARSIQVSDSECRYQMLSSMLLFCSSRLASLAIWLLWPLSFSSHSHSFALTT